VADSAAAPATSTDQKKQSKWDKIEQMQRQRKKKKENIGTYSKDSQERANSCLLPAWRRRVVPGLAED
jgi:hypothetical protein